MLDDSLTERRIEDRHVKTDSDQGEPEFDGDNVQLNVDQHTFGEQSITDHIDNVTKSRDQEVTKVREMLEQTENMMKESPKESEQQSITSRNNTSRQVIFQQTQGDRGTATRTRSQSQTHMISLGYLSDTKCH